MNWRTLHELYMSARQLGHTTAAAHAAKACGGIVLCASYKEAHEVTRKTNANADSWHGAERLRGRSRALIPDNHLMMVLTGELVRLEERVARDKLQLEQADRTSHELRLREAALTVRLRAYEDHFDEQALRGAFRALGMIGLAVAGGELLEASLRMSAVLGHPDHLDTREARELRRLNRARVAVLP